MSLENFARKKTKTLRLISGKKNFEIFRISKVENFLQETEVFRFKSQNLRQKFLD